MIFTLGLAAGLSPWEAGLRTELLLFSLLLELQRG